MTDEGGHTWREGPFDPSIDNWLELHYVPQPEEPDESFIVALTYIAPQDEDKGVFTVQLLPEDLPETIDVGPSATASDKSSIST